MPLLCHHRGVLVPLTLLYAEHVHCLYLRHARIGNQVAEAGDYSLAYPSLLSFLSVYLWAYIADR